MRSSRSCRRSASTGSKSWSCRPMARIPPPTDVAVERVPERAERPVRVLLIDDDYDDYILTRDLLEKSRIDSTLLERSIRYVLQQKRHKVELERKVAERTRELAQANDALKKADSRKDEFLATLAHELRNPLAPIRNALEIMRLGADN